MSLGDRVVSRQNTSVPKILRSVLCKHIGNSANLRTFFCDVSGRGFKSHAYTHSVQDGHHVFLNLETHKFYCLPDNYEIIDQSLEDIVVSWV